MKIGNAPCSWGVLEFDENAPVPLYKEILEEMAETGYEGTELGPWGYFPTEPAQLKGMLHGYSLELVAAFVPVPFSEASAHEEGAAEALRIAELLSDVTGAEALIVLADDNGKIPVRVQKAGRIENEDSLTTAQWKTFGKGVDVVAARVFEETGLRSVFHHHCAGYVETPKEIEILLDITNPDSVGLCFDTGHYRYGGGDPLAGMAKFSKRIRHIHFKDVDPAVLDDSIKQRWDYFTSVQNGIFCELGSGNVQFPEIVKLLPELQQASWIIVEQDILKQSDSPFRSAKNNRVYLKQLAL